MSQILSIKECLDSASRDLSSSVSARLDAEILLCFVLNIPRSRIYSHPETELNSVELEQFYKLVAERKNSVPIAYLTGKKEFYGLEFNVTPAVLIPRPETEILIEQALTFCQDKNNINILDLCTGSGCIAVSLAMELQKLGKNFTICASDISAEALQVARANAEKFDVQEKIKFIQSDLFQNIPEQKFDLILSNPPYVNKELPALSPELKYEPALALFAANQGLAVIENIARNVFNYLSSKALLIIEIGSEQSVLLQSIPEFNKRPYSVIKDLSGLDRFIRID